MDEAAFRRLISGERRGVNADLLRTALRTASIGYRAAIGFRAVLWKAGLRRVHQATVPVISVGNLTTGGTGKTPLVALVCRMLQTSGVSPGIISRGYRSVDGLPNDEKLVLSVQCPDVPHEQNSDRVAAAASIFRDHSVNAIVMDDGFQHRRLHRDLDIVLIDATNPFGFGHLLPRGLLREPLSALRRADAALITRSDLVSESDLMAIQATLLQNAPGLDGRILRVAFRPAGLLSVTRQRSELSSVRDQPVFLMTGIGNPEAFAATCRRAGLQIAGSRWFADHHHYSDSDLQAVQAEARMTDAKRIVTTLKDLVKLREAHENVLALEITPDFPVAGQFETMNELIRCCVTKKAG